MSDQNFFSLPEKHHHARRLVVLIVFLAVAVAILSVWAYYFQYGAASPAAVPVQNFVPLTEIGSTTTQDLTNKIMERISVPTKLSSGERQIIVKQFGGVASKPWLSLSPDERQAVISALNKY
ncbi:hypothetical protein KGQ27_03885 [Patescibacteria group bacterium]|nr:hypothetical protein [Patescibacteria group bacterium]MDE2011225.1 hypothetical protein [Patescibacteria group bacterium]MDE2233641.1 hypothetical protein [Patescibacteria group bacterium]